MSSEPFRIIAVDFDGTLCTNRWPEIGEPTRETIDALKAERESGSKIILWTCRQGERLDEALEWCAAYGIVFDAVNEDLPETIGLYGPESRKVYATEYWDDRAVRMPRIDTATENHRAALAPEIQALRDMLTYEEFNFRRNQRAGIYSEGNALRKSALRRAIEVLESQFKGTRGKGDPP